MLGNLISGGMTLIGGLLGQNKQDKIAEENRAFQREMAETGVQKRVADAKAAGIHAAAALGAQIASPAPISVGDSLSPAMHNAGQDISRAINAGASPDTRANATFTAAQQALALERAGLENAEIRTRLIRQNAPGTPPATPSLDQRWGIPGQGNIPIPGSLVTENPMGRSVDPAGPYSEPGHVADTGYTLTPSGNYAVVPSKEAQERMEDQAIPQLMWALRNMFLPESMGGERSHPPFDHGPGWTYNPFAGSWTPPPEITHYFRNPDGSQWRYNSRGRY